MGLIGVQWVLVGYSLAFGPSVMGVIGNLSFLERRSILSSAITTWTRQLRRSARRRRRAARGDGIFVYPVEDVIRIRTGERGRAALQYADDIDARREATGPPPDVTV